MSDYYAWECLSCQNKPTHTIQLDPMQLDFCAICFLGVMDFFLAQGVIKFHTLSGVTIEYKVGD